MRVHLLTAGRSIAIAAFWLLLRCSGSATEGESTTLQLTGAQSGESVSAALGEEIDVKLQTIGPGEYETPVTSSPSVKFVSVSYVSPANPGGPTQLFHFEAVGVGEALISIPHSANGGFSIVIEVHD
jgi:hypothetical protein